MIFYIDGSWSSITITIAHIYGIFIYTINAAWYRYFDFNILLFLQHQEITSAYSNGTFCCNIKWKCISFPLEKRASHMSLKTVHLNNEPTDEQHKNTIQTPIGLCHDSVCVRQKELWRTVRHKECRSETEELSITQLTQNNKGSHLEMCTPFRLHTTWKWKYLSMLLKKYLFFLS